MMDPTKAARVVIGLAMLGGGFGCESRSEAPAPVAALVANEVSVPVPTPVRAVKPCQKPVAVWGPDLIKEYEKNPVRAQLKYEGKLLAFAGRIESILNPLGQPLMQASGVVVRGAEPESVARYNPGDHYKALAWGAGVNAARQPVVDLLAPDGEEACPGDTQQLFDDAACETYPDSRICKAHRGKASAPAPGKPKAAQARRVELPCRPGQTPPCYE